MMKKALIAVAVAAGFASAAQAQTVPSTVTVYGVVDAGVQVTDPTVGNAGKTTALTSGNQSGSRFGLKGSEDLGSGLKAVFTLEGGFAVDTGALKTTNTIFDRQAYVGLSGDFGTVAAGNLQIAGYALNCGVGIDPMGCGFGDGNIGSTISSPTIRNANNAIAYTSPTVGGFTGVIGYSFQAAGTEVAGTSNNLHAVTALALYGNGPLTVGLAYEGIHNTAANTNDQKDVQIAGVYDFKVAKLHLSYATEKDAFVGAPLASTDARSWMIGTTVPFGANTIMASYQNRDDRAGVNGGNDRRVLGVAYTYTMSARTNAYVYLSDSKGENALADVVSVANERKYGVGIRHKF